MTPEDRETVKGSLQLLTELVARMDAQIKEDLGIITDDLASERKRAEHYLATLQKIRAVCAIWAEHPAATFTMGSACADINRVIFWSRP